MTAEGLDEFIILGASLDTGNLGVSALLASTVKCIHSEFPGVGIRLLAGVRNPVPQIVRLGGGQSVELDRVGVRCNRTIWRKNHLLRLLGSATFARLLPASWRRRWIQRNPYLRVIVSARAVLDITGGDSFSDIYGLRRLVLGSLPKMLVLMCGAGLVLLPQTYGPFKQFSGRILARMILRRSAAVYSRDRMGLDITQTLMGKRRMRTAPQFCPDVAFVLDAIRPDTGQATRIEQLKADGQQLVGLNISGLLYNGGYTGRNEFGLRCDYKSLVQNIVLHFARQKGRFVLLVPHVIPPVGYEMENDLLACREVWQGLPLAEKEKVIVLDGGYDQNQVKYLIGLCDFFIGTRMHSTIAALSQCVPTVGMAYSNKFAGVFETVGVPDCIADCRTCENAEATETIKGVFERRRQIQCCLRDNIPKVKKRIMTLFESISR